MAGNAQELRKRKLEQKLGLNQPEEIKSNFDPEILDIVWDVLSGKYDGLQDHPKIKSEPDVDWVYFLVVHNLHAAIWAIQSRYLKSLDVLEEEYVTAYDVAECLKKGAVVRRYHVVLGDNDRYYVQADELFLHKTPEFDICLYIGTLTLPEKGLDVVLATIAEKTYLLLESDCLEYCKSFIYVYFELIEQEMSSQQKATLRKLTVTTNVLSQTTERSGRQNRSSGFSLRSILNNPAVHILAGSLLSSVLTVGLCALLLRKW